MVINQEGKIKVAQYGQWDGYPSGVGVGILRFLKDKEAFEKMKANLCKVRFLNAKWRDKDFVESYDKNCPDYSDKPDNRTPEQKRWWALYCHRDLAEEVLYNIADSNDEEIILIDRKEAAMGNGWVEWSYVINIQKNTLEVYEHIDEEPIVIYDLDDLPEEDAFIDYFNQNEDE